MLELASTIFLYHERPTDAEGMLTTYRSALVRTETLAELAKELGLDQRMYLSKGEEAGGGRDNPGLLADLLEAVIGALYLDQGFRVVQDFLGQVLFPKFSEILASKAYRDQKSLLQEVFKLAHCRRRLIASLKKKAQITTKLYCRSLD